MLSHKRKLAYKIYKDRFLLSFNISLICHIVILCLIFLHTPKEEKTTLRPLSLGLLKPLKSQPQSQPQMQEISKDSSQPAKSQVNKSNVKIDKTTPKNKSISTNFDLNKMTLPQDFHPFKSAPSITQDVRNYSPLQEKLPDSAKQQIQKLYGDVYENLSKVEKDYISKSYFLNTQVFQDEADRVGYPEIAAKFGQTGQPIIEFTLYPDGHIDDIKYIRKSGYESIDDSIKHIIELSAKNLLRPPSPVRIRIQGNYFIKNRF